MLKYKFPYKPCCFKSTSNPTPPNSFTRMWLQPALWVGKFCQGPVSFRETSSYLHSALQIPSNTPVFQPPPLVTPFSMWIMVLLFLQTQSCSKWRQLLLIRLLIRSTRPFQTLYHGLLCLDRRAQNIVLLTCVFSRTIRQNLWYLSSF